MNMKKFLNYTLMSSISFTSCLLVGMEQQNPHSLIVLVVEDNTPLTESKLSGILKGEILSSDIIKDERGTISATIFPIPTGEPKEQATLILSDNDFNKLYLERNAVHKKYALQPIPNPDNFLIYVNSLQDKSLPIIQKPSDNLDKSETPQILPTKENTKQKNFWNHRMTKRLFMFGAVSFLGAFLYFFNKSSYGICGFRIEMDDKFITISEV